MSQDIRLYGSADVWDQPLQTGQRNLLQAIRDFWPTNIASVLDIGCGDGKLTSSLAEHYRDTLFVGLDSSDEALSRLPFTGIKGDAQTLPFADAAFDLVMSTDAFEHMPDATENEAWRELFRVAAKVVMVAVPFREELLDATTRCGRCGHCYHVNWHQRSYDIADIHQRTPAGWSVHSTVLTGEPWSSMLPPETHLRRSALNQWSGWSASICPECGAGGEPAAPLEPLSPLLALTLGKQLYPALLERRYCRSHSELLVIFQRQPLASFHSPVASRQQLHPATRVDFASHPTATDLEPYCQVARHVATDSGWRVQFPLYEAAPRLEVQRQPGSHGDLHLFLEDATGPLLEGCVLATGQDHATLTLPRPPVAGYYGILASCAPAAFSHIRLGEGPMVTWAWAPEQGAYAYWRYEHADYPLFVQVSSPIWIDPQALISKAQALTLLPSSIINSLQSCFDDALSLTAAPVMATPTEADRLHIEVQNLSAERDALLLRAREADQLAVQLQNLSAERDALLLRAREADQLAVQLQNLSAERDALLLRAREADQLAILLQNLSAEHRLVMESAQLTEAQVVQLQNLSAERDALLQRAQEADRLAVQLQNLLAEHDETRELATSSQRASGELRATIAALEQQNAHLIDRIQQTTEELELRNGELNNHKTQLERLNQHIENRLGAMARQALAKLPGKL